MQMLNDEEQEKCRKISYMYEVLSDKFKLQHYETILQCNTVN